MTHGVASAPALAFYFAMTSMEPTNFNKARWHYCQIFTALTSDDAVKAGVISERNVKPLLFFFMRVWDNDKIRHWLAPKEPEEVKENRLIALIGWIFKNGTFFTLGCSAIKLANLLIGMNVLNLISKRQSIQVYFCLPIPNEIKSEANRIKLELSK